MASFDSVPLSFDFPRYFHDFIIENVPQINFYQVELVNLVLLRTKKSKLGVVIVICVCIRLS